MSWHGGNRRENSVLGDDNRLMFQYTLGEMAGRSSILIHAFALMDNHYHLVLEPPRGEPRGWHAVAPEHRHAAFRIPHPKSKFLAVMPVLKRGSLSYFVSRLIAYVPDRGFLDTESLSCG